MANLGVRKRPFFTGIGLPLTFGQIHPETSRFLATCLRWHFGRQAGQATKAQILSVRL